MLQHGKHVMKMSDEVRVKCGCTSDVHMSCVLLTRVYYLEIIAQKMGYNQKVELIIFHYLF